MHCTDDIPMKIEWGKADIIASYDVSKRMDYLYQEFYNVQRQIPPEEENAGAEQCYVKVSWRDNLIDHSQEIMKEHEFLRKLRVQCELYSIDWHYGTAELIRDEYFSEYVKDICNSVNMTYGIPDQFPYNCMEINLEKAEKYLKQDYTEIRINDQSYWIRNS